jgi:hypothetical protein
MIKQSEGNQICFIFFLSKTCFVVAVVPFLILVAPPNTLEVKEKPSKLGWGENYNFYFYHVEIGSTCLQPHL